MEKGNAENMKNSENKKCLEYDVSYNEKMRILRMENVCDFDLTHIFECGQCFRWELEADGSYTGVAGGRAVSLYREGGVLIMKNCGKRDFEEFWFDYFDLGRDYGMIKQALSEEDQIMSKAVDYGSGIRLLQQDPWEAVISFIISQNSNIPRIRKCIDSLCVNFGESIGVYRGRERFSFPKAARLAELSLSDLSVCRLGYRDKYVLATAQAVARDGEETLSALRSADYSEARDYLQNLTGVGPKVADCILLFGLLKYESFPLDVWMKRIMSELYGFDKEDVKGMSKYAGKHFGERSGFAQQYLFYYAKENL